MNEKQKIKKKVKTMLKVKERGEEKLEANSNKAKDRKKTKVNFCADIKEMKRLTGVRLPQACVISPC
jgi:hypothetical protein